MSYDDNEYGDGYDEYGGYGDNEYGDGYDEYGGYGDEKSMNGYDDNEYGGYDDNEYGDENDDYKYEEEEEKRLDSYLTIQGTTFRERNSICNQQYSDIKYRTPKEKFIDEYCSFISNNKSFLSLTNEDLDIMEKYIHEIPLIQYKNHISYVLGYIVHTFISSKNIPSEIREKIKSLLSDKNNVTMSEVIKYGIYWTRITQNK